MTDRYIVILTRLLRCMWQTVSNVVVLAWWAETSWPKSVRARSTGRVPVTAARHCLPVTVGQYQWPEMVSISDERWSVLVTRDGQY